MTRARDEDGWVMAIAMTLMALIATMALATFAFVDTQQKESAVTRHRETAFNLAEAVMNAQIYELSRDWAGVGEAATPYAACTQGSTGSRCPSTSTISGLFASPDTTTGMTWRTEIHDNNAPNPQFYSDITTGTRGAPGYDANDDGKVWVRTQATARGKTRTLVALVGTQEQVEDLPHAALISGRLAIGNNGKKVIIDTSGGSTASGFVAVRCSPTPGESSPCLGHALGSGLLSQLTALLNDLLSLLNIQISPNVAVYAYPDVPSMPTDELARLKARADADGKVYANCPESLPTAPIVFIESGNCSYSANSVINSAAEPGFVVLENNATLTLRGTADFYGVIYHPNQNHSTGTLVDVGGNVVVHGGILVDGQATTAIGESAFNLRLDLGAFDAIKSYGSAGIIQNTFREIKSS